MNSVEMNQKICVVHDDIQQRNELNERKQTTWTHTFRTADGHKKEEIIY